MNAGLTGPKGRMAKTLGHILYGMVLKDVILLKRFIRGEVQRERMRCALLVCPECRQKMQDKL
jgi:hypothetical protein